MAGDIIIPLGMAFFMLISCVNNFISKGTWNSHIECPVRPNGRRYYHPAGYVRLYAHFMCKILTKDTAGNCKAKTS
jgi:hypothetical protein